MYEYLRSDLRRLSELKGRGSRPGLRFTVESLFFDSGFQAVALHRLAHVFKRRKIPFLGPAVGRISQWLTGVEIAPGARIGPGLVISHGQGIVVGQWSVLGRGCHLHQQVTLGAKDVGRIEEMPRLGDRVVVGAGAKLIGGIVVGDGAIVGPNAFVTTDVPAGGKARAPRAEVRGPRSAEAPQSRRPS